MANMGRCQTQLCALGILAVLLPHCQVFGRICGPSNRTGPVFFTQVLNVAEYINYGASKPLLCCASGFHSIQWYILNAAAAWEPYPPNSSGTEQPNTEEDDQVLRIYHAMDFQNTKFRCDLIVDGSVVLNHTVRLYVSHCSTRAKGPILIEPFPQNHTIYDYSGNISLYCTGDFGCYKHNDVQIVMWSVDTVSFDNNASGVSSRYHLLTNESEDKTTLGVTLTIEKVEPIDTTRTFICTIMNDQLDQGRTDRMVWITKKDRPESPTMTIVMAVCITVGIFLIALLVCLCMYLCIGPQVKLYFYVRCPCCRRKAMDADKYVYHVFLYHAEDDRVKAERIKKKLKKMNYNVFISADIIPGTETINTTSACLEKSAAVYFLYTENLLHDPWALKFLIHVVEDGKDILCLEIDDFKPQQVFAAIKDAQCENGACSIEVSTDGLNIDGENVDRHEEESKINDIGYWKRLPKVKFPTEKDSQRKHKNFWCYLQNNLPKPTQETVVKAKAKCEDDSKLLLAPPTPDDYHRNANMDNALRAKSYLHNEVQQYNPQLATINDRIRDQVKVQDSEQDIAIAHMAMDALETENEQATFVADTQTHAYIADDLQFIDPNLRSHTNDHHGNASHEGAVNLIHPRQETVVKAKAKCEDDSKLLLVPPTPDDYHRNANMDNDLTAKSYLHNEVQQYNPQLATITDRIRDQVKVQDSEQDIAIAHMAMDALETENEQATFVADTQTHADIADDLQFIDPNLRSHTNDHHGNASHGGAVNLIHPRSEEGFMNSGVESPPTNASSSCLSDCDDYLFTSGSYTGTSSGGYSAGISGQSDSGYSRSQTSSSFGAHSGTSQSLSPTSPSFNGLSSGELLSVTDSGEIKHVEVKKDGDKKALTLTIGPTGHTQNVSNTFVSPESGYSSTNENRPFISIMD